MVSVKARASGLTMQSNDERHASVSRIYHRGAFQMCVRSIRPRIRLDLMADGAHHVRSYGIEKSGVIAVH